MSGKKKKKSSIANPQSSSFTQGCLGAPISYTEKLSYVWGCNTSWSSDEEDDDDSNHSLFLARGQISLQVEDHLSMRAQSVESLVFSRHLEFADRFEERSFLDGLTRRTKPLECVRIDQYFPLRWHTPNELISSLIHLEVKRLVVSNIHFSKSLPIPWKIHASCLELRDCWMDEDLEIPSQCHVSSVCISGGFGLAPEGEAPLHVLEVVKQFRIAEFGYVVDHWGECTSLALLNWVKRNTHLKHFDMGTDIVACLTATEWLQWMAFLTNFPLQSLTLHVGHRFNDKRAKLLQQLLLQNRRLEQVRFVGLSQQLWMQSIASVCAWNRFANGVEALANDSNREELMQVTIQHSQSDVRRLAFVFAEHTDYLCRCVHDLSSLRKRKRLVIESELIDSYHEDNFE